MSGAGNRLNVVPTVTVLAVIKTRLSGAQMGFRLLKKKADALTMRYRQILKKIIEAGSCAS
jgi:V-type H+-transporting ATPase subunit D